MKRVEPKVYLIGEQRIVTGDERNNIPGILDYFQDIGVDPEENAMDFNAGTSEPELIPEFYGRLCYRSFKPGLNVNVKKVREGNDKYLANILHVNHGSVLEHSQINFLFANVSRVFTHELVRHRVGCAISQESLRYVRLEDLSVWIPSCLEGESARVEEVFRQLEDVQKQLAVLFDIDGAKNFARKKELTSAFRRLAPIGLATTIGWSANFRTLRHVIAMRTAVGAEEEIRVVFNQVAEICRSRYPNMFQDMSKNNKGEWVFD